MRRTFFTFLLVIFTLCGHFSHAQSPVPELGPVFKDDVVPTVEILIAEELLDQILAPGNEESDVEHPATFIFDNGEIRDTVEMIGFRLRGNTSRFASKKSFKVSFNTFEAGKDYKGLEKLNLNGEHNDPSIIRSKICWDILRDMEVPAPRANHVELYINGDYFGLYINVEQIDEEFVESRFGDKTGNLFKCLYPADLDYRGPNGSDYKHDSNGRKVYDLKTNEEADNYDRLAKFINVINNVPPLSFREELEPIFNVNSYLKSLAVEMITGHWDGYSFLKNNYYLYENQITGKIEYIHFDMDNTLGIDWVNQNWSDRNIYNWKNQNEVRPLYSRVIEDPVYRSRLSFYIDQLLENYFKPEIINPKIDQIKSMIQASAEADVFRTMDYGFSIADFNNSYDEAITSTNHVVFGLKEFIQLRYNSAVTQLDAYNLAPIIWYIDHSPAIIGETITFTARVEDDNLFEVYLNTDLNSGGVETTPMLDDGLNGDLVAGDGIFTAQMPGLVPPAILEYYVTAEDELNNVSRDPLSGVITIDVDNATPVPLFINEFMANNDNVIADEEGEFDDWFEIYNGGDGAIWLGDKYVSDNKSIPDKFNLPQVFLGPGDFLLIWADGQPAQGPNHANFRLSKDGDDINIFYGEEFGFLPIHKVDFGPQQQDESEGLMPDGQEPFIVLPFATPGRSNIVTGLKDKELKASLGIFPNPFTQMLTIRSQKPLKDAQVEIYGISGRRLFLSGMQGREATFDVGLLSTGVYFLKISDDGGTTSYRILKR